MTLSSEQILWRQGQPADRVVILCGAAAIVSTCTPGGDRRVMELMTRGSVLGLGDALSGRSRCCEAEVVIPGPCLVFTGDQLRYKVRQGGAAALAVAGLMSTVARQSGGRVAELGYGSVAARLARVVLRLCNEHGALGARGTVVPIRISRARLALVLGCRPETLCRALQDPLLSRTLTVEADFIVVPDMAQLTRLAT
ncbi:MAG: Crp/Fnr family transcriptional regulator [Pseudomonadota bacterium]|nr:Crp/Fnr family transcriptional regulator [Pseudomonadota bacterium]